MSLNESIVEDAALTWFGELDYTVGHGPQLAPGEPASERDSFGDVVLVECLRAAPDLKGRGAEPAAIQRGAGGERRPASPHGGADGKSGVVQGLRTIDGEGDAPKTALELETLVRGVFDRQRFLDLLQHFIVFEEDSDTGTLHKIIAGYHQFHAVNAAVEETVRASGMSGAGDPPERNAEPNAGGADRPQRSR